MSRREKKYLAGEMGPRGCANGKAMEQAENAASSPLQSQGCGIGLERPVESSRSSPFISQMRKRRLPQQDGGRAAPTPERLPPSPQLSTALGALCLGVGSRQAQV